MPFSSTKPSIRARILSKFPARVLAGANMLITKSGGTYTFSAPYEDIPLSGLETISQNRLVGRDAGDGAAQQLTVANGLAFTGAGGLEIELNSRWRYLEKIITGSPITTGVKADFYIPFLCNIFQIILLADQVGSIVFDVWRDSYANYPPTVADTLVGGGTKPTLSSAISSTVSPNDTGWSDITLHPGDVVRLNVDSVSTVTRVTFIMQVFVR